MVSILDTIKNLEALHAPFDCVPRIPRRRPLFVRFDKVCGKHPNLTARGNKPALGRVGVQRLLLLEMSRILCCRLLLDHVRCDL
jgi:hypothetical protein